jgi:integrase/recombinase XerD
VLKEIGHIRFFGEARHRWPEAVTEWGEEAQRTLRPGTLKRYLASLGQMRGILDALYVDEINKKTISRIAFRKDISNATRRRDLTAVSAVLKYCIAKSWREDNPAKAFDRSHIKEKRDPIVLPSEADIDTVIAAAPGNFAHMIRWAQYTGMREEECASLERADISLPRRAAQLNRTKTNRPRSVPLDDRALDVLTAIPTSLHSKFIFWHEPAPRYERHYQRDDPKHYRYSNVAANFCAIVSRARRTAKRTGRAEPRAFRFHDLRHWFAVDYLRRAGSIYTLQQILGHASLTTTEIYLRHLTPDEQLVAKRIGGTKGGTDGGGFSS